MASVNMKYKKIMSIRDDDIVCKIKSTIHTKDIQRMYDEIENDKILCYKVYNEDNIMIGSYIIESTVDMIRLKYLYVEKQFRRQGYATLIINHILDNADKNQKKIFCASANRDADMFYRHLNSEEHIYDLHDTDIHLFTIRDRK